MDFTVSADSFLVVLGNFFVVEAVGIDCLDDYDLDEPQPHLPLQPERQGLAPVLGISQRLGCWHRQDHPRGVQKRWSATGSGGIPASWLIRHGDRSCVPAVPSTGDSGMKSNA